jgi:hypothetical protein
MFFMCFSYLCLFLNVNMFCDVCLVGLSFTVGIFSHHFPFLTPSPFHPYCPYPFNSHMGPFKFLLFHTLHVHLLSSPLCPLQVLIWCLLGALRWCVGACERCLCLVNLYSCLLWIKFSWIMYLYIFLKGYKQLKQQVQCLNVSIWQVQWHKASSWLTRWL